MNRDLHAQGTIEYLVILAVILIIALLAVSMLPGLINPTAINDSTQKTQMGLGTDLWIDNIVYDANLSSAINNNDYNSAVLIVLKSQTNKDLTIESIMTKINGQEVTSYYTTNNVLSINGEKYFLVKRNSRYNCEVGKKLIVDLKVGYKSEVGIPHFETKQIGNVECTDLNINRPEYDFAN
ncbi:MAG: hypothetical protein PHQ98_03295 [Candidatus ainarchaeum sp.]|nr:hypothetical protein [Candidatus ainarchaeum sp.]